jgi:hypothetical protein
MTTPQPKITSTQPYEVCAYHTRTGEVAGWLPLAELPEWERGLNIAGSWSVAVSLDDRYVTKDVLNGWSTEWDWSWAIVQGTQIWQAGPVKGEDYHADGDNQSDFSGVGLLTLLVEKRVLVNKNRTSRGVITDIDADLAFGTGTVSEKGAPIPAANRNLALATVIKRLFENTLGEPGGDLPIDVPTEDYTGDTERSYPGYELATPGGRALDITQVIDGPEMELVPYFTTTARKFVRHRLLIGTPANTNRLGNLTYPHVWDTGRGLCQVGFSRNGERRTTRTWEKGEGSDRNTNAEFAEDLDGVTTGHAAGTRPLLETVGTGHANAKEADTLQSYADSDIVNGSRSTLTLSVEVRTDATDGQGKRSRSPRLIEVSPGDTGILNVTDHRRLPDGPYEIRILRMHGNRTVDRATLDVQVLSGGFP